MKKSNPHKKGGRGEHHFLALAVSFLFFFSSEERGFFFASSVFMFPFRAGFCTTGLAEVGAKNRLMSCVHTHNMEGTLTIT